MQRIRLLISEDHNLVRHGLIKMLEEYSDIYVVAEAEDGQSLIDKYIEFKPDIVLTDISMPKLNGMEAAKRIFSTDKSAKIIFLTIYQDDEHIFKAIKLGASGLVSKEAMKGELINAIRTVTSGDKYFAGKSEEEIVAIQNRFNEKHSLLNSNDPSLLSDREKKILMFIAQGLTSDEIAEKIAVGRRVVDNCRSEIMVKLDLKSLPQLIKYAVEFSFKEREKIN